ncbi:MAG: argininosuccinate synthase [Candidatus Schekmanbacteria bacterium]|nr:argininosuccinate synthase [Candidatus Schekmanbacteria bacterium]
MRVVLGNGGGLSTAVSLHALREQGHEVVCVHVDMLGADNEENAERIRKEGLRLGAAASYSLHASDELANQILAKALPAHPEYDGGYHLSAALSRPLIVEKLVDFYREHGCGAIAHGAAGHRNDFVRFNSYARALEPEIEILTPLRGVSLPREALLEEARTRGIGVFSQIERDYQVDENIWGRCLTYSSLDPWLDAPEDGFRWSVRDPSAAPLVLQIGFDRGVPTALDGRPCSLAAILRLLNREAGRRGIGRADIVENRILGFKRRALYEAPGARVLILAHREIENLTCPQDLLFFKRSVEQEYARLVYSGHYFSPLLNALEAFLAETQNPVTGDIRVRLADGVARVVGRRSEQALVPPVVLQGRRAAVLDLESRAVEGLAESLGLSTRAFAALAPSAGSQADDVGPSSSLDSSVLKRILRLAGIQLQPPARPASPPPDSDTL